ncbi:MAG: flagellar protein FlaG [Polaromonas sp.]|jgi:flagellar protein FlaG|nr:flagellar protein FlaG [Polaromonas sp.]
MLDIQGGLRVATAPVPTPQVASAGVAAAVAPPPEAPKVMPVPRADIKVDTEVLRKNLNEAIGRLNQMMQDGGRGLNFMMDEKLGRPIVTVVNQETGEVVRQIPNDVIVKLGHSIEDLKGVLHSSMI